MSEKVKTQEVVSVRFKTPQEAVDAYVEVLNAYASDPSDENAQVAIELKDAIDNQYEPEDEFGDNIFADIWIHEVAKGDGNRVEMADQIEGQLFAEREGSGFREDAEYWDHDAYEEYHDQGDF